MTTEDDFHRQLDEKPDNWQLRMIFADWLQDHGDPRAAGYRAIAVQERRPLQGRHKEKDTWWWHAIRSSGGDEAFFNVIPADWFDLLPSKDGNNYFWPVFSSKGGIKTRRQCEDALALAFAKLPEDRQKELLTPSKTGPKKGKTG
jgi:uncharacterized protein (TIGR02996 family)